MNAETDKKATEAKAAAAPKVADADRPTRHTLFEDTVLDLGAGAEFVRRPKRKALMEAFKGGKTVAEGTKIAAEAQKDRLKAAKFVENPTGYMRSYLNEMINSGALNVVKPGTAPAPAPKPEKADAKPADAKAPAATTGAKPADAKAPAAK